MTKQLQIKLFIVKLHYGCYYISSFRIAGSFNSTANFPVNFTLTDFGEVCFFLIYVTKTRVVAIVDPYVSN